MSRYKFNFHMKLDLRLPTNTFLEENVATIDLKQVTIAQIRKTLDITLDGIANHLKDHDNMLVTTTHTESVMPNFEVFKPPKKSKRGKPSKVSTQEINPNDL